jgi:hypothetical protein
MSSPIDRLQTYTHTHQQMIITLASATVAALAYDAVTQGVEFGERATDIFYAALLCFGVSGLSGGVVAANIAEFEGESVPTSTKKSVRFLAGPRGRYSH